MIPDRVAAVVPAYQAEASIGEVVRGLLARWPFRPEGGAVVVVDDGSTDRTAELAERAGARVVRHPSNRGKGAALRTGFARAMTLGATAAVTVDADGQHPAEEAIRLARVDSAPGALVLGVRDLRRDGAPRPNRFSNGISNLFLSLFTGHGLHDTQCGLRRYPIPAALELGTHDDGYAYEAEAVLRASHAGMPLVEIPVRVVYPPGELRVTHFDSVRDPARIVRRVLLTLAEQAVGPGGR